MSSRTASAGGEALTWPGVLAACSAVALPALIAFNVAPSATFFNQAAAYVGWGAFLILLAARLPRQARPRSSGAVALLAAMALAALSALAASGFGAVPLSLSLSNTGTILAAILVIAIGASTARAGLGGPAFRAFCIGLVVAGAASALIGLVQVFAPRAPDGTWIALASIPGRATGNLRQPNHLSSLLLWSVVAAVWLGETKVLRGFVAAGLALGFIYVVVLTGSRTGALGMLTLAGWGLLDRRLSRRARLLLVLAPVLYAGMFWATSLWAAQSQQLFGGQTRFATTENFSSSRIDIWSNTIALIKAHPWLGVGFGDFNFAWTLTPFPGRPTEFFDHSHNLVLNFMAELGVPMATLVIALMVFALWRALRHAVEDGREPAPESGYPVQRAAFAIVFLVAVHSMLEYPLWYSYFLLPAAFAFGLCLERPLPRDEAAVLARAERQGEVTRPYVLAAMFLLMGGTLAVYDYMRVVVIFAPPAGAGPLEQRIADGRKSVLFAHHADYAAATIAEHPGQVMEAFRRAPHYLLDTRLMVAWAKALDERGESDKASYLAARLREFRNEGAAEFFAPCRSGASAPAAAPATTAAAAAANAPAASSAAPNAGAAAKSPPFQCRAPTRSFRFEDFRELPR